MATIRKRTLPSGEVRWLADYRDVRGKRRAKQFERRKDADAWLTKAKREVQLGLHVAESDSLTISEVADLWLERAERKGLEPSTTAQYRQHVDLHIKPLIGGTKLAKLTIPAVHSFADDLREGRSLALQKKILASLGAIVSEAARRGLIAYNPVREVKLSSTRRGQEAKQWPTQAELKAILKVAPEVHRALIFTALFSGARASELRGLRWQDVDLKAGAMHIRQRADRYNAIGSPKTAAAIRDIPLTPGVVALLREHKMRSTFKKDDDLVFPTGAGKVESLANWTNRVIGPVQILAGVVRYVDGEDRDGNPIKVAKGKFGLHALRHSAAALLAREGMDVKALQRMLGHANISTTMQIYAYAISTLDEDRAVLQNVENKLIG